MFSDESRFGLIHNDGCVRVWTRPEQHLESTVPEVIPFGERSMVWAAITLTGRMELIVIRTTNCGEV